MCEWDRGRQNEFTVKTVLRGKNYLDRTGQCLKRERLPTYLLPY